MSQELNSKRRATERLVGINSDFVFRTLVAALPFSHSRAGDVPDLTADPTLAKNELGWTATKTLEEMCDDLWRWQSSHPQGFQEEEK